MTLILCCLLIAQQPVFERDETKLGVPFERFTTRDEFDRTIKAYLSTPPKDAADKPLPLILFVTGSGCQSVFTKHEKGLNSGLQGLIYMVAKGRARVLVVEKPGVKFLDAPARFGGASDGTREFLEEHTLPRWAAANVAALRAAITQPGIDAARILAIGHSEGGIVAARVAAEAPEVTHVAPLSCGGVTQLFSLAELARAQASEEEAAAAMQSVYDEWAKILVKPDSVEDFWMGHPYRRWSTFLKDSVIDELKRGKAKIYIAHGTADKADSIIGFDVMRAELIAQGRDVTAERIEGGDHGYSVPGKPGGIQTVVGNVVEWFLK